ADLGVVITHDPHVRVVVHAVVAGQATEDQDPLAVTVHHVLRSLATRHGDTYAAGTRLAIHRVASYQHIATGRNALGGIVVNGIVANCYGTRDTDAVVVAIYLIATDQRVPAHIVETDRRG